jgi:hypothetical protein
MPKPSATIEVPLIDALERLGADLIDHAATLEDGIAAAITKLAADPAPTLTAIAVLHDLRALIGREEGDLG